MSAQEQADAKLDALTHLDRASGILDGKSCDLEGVAYAQAAAIVGLAHAVLALAARP